MKRILRAPLLHFLLPGTAIFATCSLVSKRSSGQPAKVDIAAGQVAAMAEGFARYKALDLGPIVAGSGDGQTRQPKIRQPISR